jgi:hypothetical protein
MSGEKRRASKKTVPVQPIELRAAEREALQALDDVAVSHALHRGDFAPVVRYLRKIVARLIKHQIPGRICSTATIGLLADMLERRESTPWHLKRVRPRRGKPSDFADTALRNIGIGARIAAHPQSGEFIGPLRPSDPQPALKAAIADICAKSKIKSAHAYKCFELFKKYRFHNNRSEPMPIPDRPSRRRIRAAT